MTPNGIKDAILRLSQIAHLLYCLYQSHEQIHIEYPYFKEMGF